MHYLKRLILQDMVRRILKFYDKDGYPVEGYENRLVLPKLTKTELTHLREVVNGNF